MIGPVAQLGDDDDAEKQVFRRGSLDALDDLRVSGRQVIDADVRVEEKRLGSRELGTRFDGWWLRRIREVLG